MEIKHLNNDSFQEFISDKGLVVVDFYASWCGPCKMMALELEEFAKEYQNVNVAKIDVDVADRVAREYKIMSVPTLIFFKNGEMIDKNIGYITKEDIVEIISKYID